ncbi:MAG: transporter substrate-binding domain-containing protein [Bacteroidetes bacterium]|nr:transporter substrate-binding domain-containing protein [Bacteroidota bacterium]
MNGIKHTFTLLIFALGLFSSCVMESSKKQLKFNKNEYKLDLEGILKRGKLVVLAENSSSSYFIYREKEMGFEYEVLKEFAKEIGVELEIRIVENLDNVMEQLQEGDGDIVACNFTVTSERQNSIDFSVPLLTIQQVLVQRKPSKDPGNINTLLTEPSQLARKKVNVWGKSSYYDRLIALQEEIGDTIFVKGEPGMVSAEELIELVSEGLIDYTVVEENVAKINQRFFENLDVNLALSAKQKIGFGLRKSSPILKARLDDWMLKFVETNVYKYIYHKYFELSQVNALKADAFKGLKPGQISKFDDFFKAAGAKNDINWRWLASLAYQETRFNPNITSFGGAYSMMQFMPEVGPKYGVFPDSPPEKQIHGGAKKLKKDFNSWEKDIPNELQRMKFALASYNCGKGHVLDAQRLAIKYGKDPKMWDDNVEEMVLKLSRQEYYGDEVVRNGSMRGSITYKYVREIYSRFLQYSVQYN